MFGLALSFLSGAMAFSEPMAQAHHLYSVVFEVTTDHVGKIDTLVVSEVIDPATGSTRPVDVPVPDVYVAEARAWLGQKGYKPDDHFFTYTFFDPARPTQADIDPKSGPP